MAQNTTHLQQLVVDYIRRDFVRLRPDFTIDRALEEIRKQELSAQIIYFYVVDEEDHLLGVVPTRGLLTARPAQRLSEVMVTQVIVLPATATVLDACEMFVLHKLLAFPVVGDDRRILGTIDINLLREEFIEASEDDSSDEIFEILGCHLAQVRGASPWRAFRFRFPWLLTTIASGTICALLAGAFEMTIAKSIVLAFFLTMVLGLGERVSIQSMTVTIQALRSIQPTLRWYWMTFRRESGTAILLGSACGLLVGLIVWLWRGTATAALAIGGSIVLALAAACLFGLSVPALLHALRLDPKISAGPLTLALTDIFTLVFYFGLATILM